MPDQKSLVETGEIHPVFFEICEAFRFVPDDFHGLYCIYIIIRCQWQEGKLANAGLGLCLEALPVAQW
jgi:hypothetical protein